MEILQFLKALMPSSAFQGIDEALQDVMATRSGSLLSVGLIAAIYFASNGVFSLMTTFNQKDPRGYWRQKLISFALTIGLGFLLISGLSLFLLTQFVLEYLVNANPKFSITTYYLLIVIQWIMTFILIFGAITLLYRHGDSRSERWRYIIPGAALASFLVVLTSIGYSYYANSWSNYNKLYGSLGAMIATMLWLYFNSMVLIIGHDFNRSLVHTRLSLMRSKSLD
jgi:membrane protein